MYAGAGGNNEIIALDMAVNDYPSFGIGFGFGFIKYFANGRSEMISSKYHLSAYPSYV